jgi:2-oxoisovalerate dehydrogenase E1 component
MKAVDSTLLKEIYKIMYLGRKGEERILELYRQGLVKGTVLVGEGNEGAIVGLAKALDQETDVCNFMQRDFCGYLAWGKSLFELFSHYLANKESSTGGKDGNVHHGDPKRRMLPMISHLGAMIPNVVGAVWALRHRGLPAVGAAIVGDGGTSTGDVHEAMNIASVLGIPVLFFVENNHWAYSTPTSKQFKCGELSQRAQGYGMDGETIDGTDPLFVYHRVKEITDRMRKEKVPYLLETRTYRLQGHAAYDTGDYVPPTELAKWRKKDPLLIGRYQLLDNGVKEKELEEWEDEWTSFVSEEANRAIGIEAVTAEETSFSVLAPPGTSEIVAAAIYGKGAPGINHTGSGLVSLPSVEMENATPVQAINLALKTAMKANEMVFIMGEDIGHYEGPFKTTKDLFSLFGEKRVMDMPLAESGFTGFAIGAAAMGMRPVIEMQFSDFATDAVTQIGVNGGSYYFRTGCPIPLTIRMPTGGGLSFGPFHSQDLEGLFGTFPGITIVYPSRVEDFFLLLLASIYDDNPVLFFESKFLHRRIKSSIFYDGTLPNLREITSTVVKEGEDLTILAWGSMFHEALMAVELVEKKRNKSIEVIDPRVLKPMDYETLTKSIKKTHRLLVVHESWRTGGLGSGILDSMVESNFLDFDAPPSLLAPPDIPVPFAPELEAWYRPNVDSIASKIEELLEF